VSAVGPIPEFSVVDNTDVRSRIHNPSVDVGWIRNMVCSKGLKRASHAVELMIDIELCIKGDWCCSCLRSCLTLCFSSCSFCSLAELLGNPWVLLNLFKLGCNVSIRLPSRWPNRWVDVVAFVVPVFLPLEAIAIWLWFLAIPFVGGISLAVVRDSERSAESSE
jgi:hypothetical protein